MASGRREQRELNGCGRFLVVIRLIIVVEDKHENDNMETECGNPHTRHMSTRRKHPLGLEPEPDSSPRNKVIS